MSLPWLTLFLGFGFLWLLTIPFRANLTVSVKAASPITFGVLLLCAFTAGGWRYQRAENDFAEDTVAQYNGRGIVAVEGTVIAPPERYANYQEMRIKTRQILSSEILGEWQKAKGKIQVRLPLYLDIQYGNQVLLEGKLNASVREEESLHNSWLGRQGIYSRMYFPVILKISDTKGNWLMGGIYNLHMRAQQIVKELMPHPESALLSGILLGVENDIPEYLQQAYRASGTAHIIAISGFNMALIAGVVIRLCRRILPYGWSSLAAILSIAIYCAFVGANPAVVRAAIMSVIAIPAYLIGREVIGFHSLGLAAGIMALFNPLLLWDLSFQLSFCATLGIMAFTDLLSDWFEKLFEKARGGKPPEFLASILSDFVFTNLAAQFGVLAITLAQFKSLSLLSPLANLLILPVQPLIMLAGGAALLAGLLFLPLGKLLGAITWPLLRYTNQVVLRFGLLPSSLVIKKDVYAWLAAVAFVLCAVPAIYYQLTTTKEVNDGT